VVRATDPYGRIPDFLDRMEMMDKDQKLSIPDYYYPIRTTYPEAWVRFPALPDFLRSSGSGTGSTQSREYN
jgi:hypothetical protein